MSNIIELNETELKESLEQLYNSFDNGYESDGPMFNIYHVGPAQTADPDEYVTEVCFPVK